MIRCKYEQESASTYRSITLCFVEAPRNRLAPIFNPMDFNQSTNKLNATRRGYIELTHIRCPA
jgi:hypothetical protein